MVLCRGETASDLVVRPKKAGIGIPRSSGVTETTLGSGKNNSGGGEGRFKSERHLLWMIKAQEQKANTSCGSWKSIIKADDR